MNIYADIVHFVIMQVPAPRYARWKGIMSPATENLALTPNLKVNLIQTAHQDKTLTSAQYAWRRKFIFLHCFLYLG